MEVMLQNHHESGALFHFERPRLNELFKEAVKYPLVLVCAGAGYGKTSAVHDFAQKYQITTAWIQFSERDNIGARFWENYTHTIARVNLPFARAIGKLGFPDTADKLNQYHSLVHDLIDLEKRIIVLDDFHYVQDTQVIRFAEKAIQNMPIGTSVFLITRTTPRLNITGMISKGRMFNISESDLRFTDYELAQYFSRLNIPLQPESLGEIMADTEGWAFAINLIARSYQKAPGYGGYLRSAMKTNIFRLMETEIWNSISARVQYFMIRLSLIDHLSFDLITLLAGEDKDIIPEMEKQNAYVRRDFYINAFIIHPLFLEFLTTKQEILSEEQKRLTYTLAGGWCDRNGFKIDALSYYEKIADYSSIVSILFSLPTQIPENIAKFTSAILDRAPAKVFEEVEFLAVMHVRSNLCQGLWQKSIELAEYYEAKFLKLPENNIIRIRTLSRIYYTWSYLRGLMCTMDDRYDFDFYIEKSCQTLSILSESSPKPAAEMTDLEFRREVSRAEISGFIEPGQFPIYCPGPWINRAGSSRKGAPEEFIGALRRKTTLMAGYPYGFKTGEAELALGELKFYQGEIHAADHLITRALGEAREYKEPGIVHMALFYSLRINIAQGNFEKAEQALREIKSQLDENQYSNRFINYDISLAWYCCILGMAEKVPAWLKQNFTPYGHAGFIENFANQMKARFFYLTRDYPPLLSYIREMKQRESFLFGRLEMLAMEACVYYKMKDKKKSFAVLTEAFKTASPNNLLMPFIELGKDMRTLTTATLKEPVNTIPDAWLISVNHRAASYAKRQIHIITKYKQANHLTGGVVLSPRETDILTDLSHGLTRVEIAASRNLSVNTVKMIINMIYSKVGAENLADLIRIAVERKMI